MSIADRLRALLGRPTRGGAPVVAPDTATCEDALSALWEYLDGELHGVAHERVKAHFDMCAKCYPKLRMEESFRVALRRASGGQQAPPELRERLLDVLARAVHDVPTDEGRSAAATGGALGDPNATGRRRE